MHIELTDAERDELIRLVRERHAELNPELARAMDTNYRERVREHRRLLESLLNRLGAETKMAA